MRPQLQYDTILNYVTEHPGCTCPEIVKNTSVPRASVTSALHNLVREKFLCREGRERHFRYYKYEKPVKRNSRGEAIPDHDLPNPLTAFINQRLREVRTA